MGIRNTPDWSWPRVLRVQRVLVSVAVVMTVAVPVLVGGLLHDGRLGGGELQPYVPLIGCDSQSTPGPGTTLTCRPGSTPVTHNEACMKLRILHPRCERPSCPTPSTPSSSISSNGSARAHAPTPKSSRPGGRHVHACRFGRPLRSVASSTVNLHRKAAPALRFPPPGQSTCASIAASECHPIGDRTSSRRARRLVHVLAFVTILLISLPSSRLCSPAVETKHPRREAGELIPTWSGILGESTASNVILAGENLRIAPTKFYDWLVACDDRHRLRRG
jgi:hypothetical protein